MPKYIIFTLLLLALLGGLYVSYNHFYGDKSPLAAYKRLRKIETPGCKTELTPDGLAFIATGEGRYDNNISNEDLKRIQQQSAFVIAYNQALNNLAIALDGFDFTNLDESLWLNNNAVVDDNTLTQDNKAFHSKMVKDVKDCYLRGFEFYEMNDPAPYGKVTVTIISSPKTIRNINERYSATIIGCNNIQQGIDSVKKEVLNRPMPFIGTRQIYCPSTGEIAFVGCGTGLILSSKNERMKQINEQRAELEATLRAEAGLCGAINGIIANSRDFNSNQNIDQTKEYEKIEIEKQNEAETKNNPLNRESKILPIKPIREKSANILTGSIISNATKGKIPAGVSKESFLSGDGHWVYTIAVYLPSAEKAAREMYQMMLQGDTLPNQESSASVQNRNSNEIIDSTQSDNQKEFTLEDYKKMEEQAATIPTGQVTDLSELGDEPEVNKKSKKKTEVPAAVIPTAQFTNINDL